MYKLRPFLFTQMKIKEAARHGKDPFVEAESFDMILLVQKMLFSIPYLCSALHIYGTA